MNQFFKGNLGLIFKADIAANLLFNDPYVVVVSLDEDNDLQQTYPEFSNRIHMGTILLPDVESLWSLSSNEFDMFQMQYYTYLKSPEASEYMFTLIGLMYLGYKVVFYYPDETSEVIQYLYAFIEKEVGIHAVIPSKPNDIFCYDINKIPMYLSGIYYGGFINANEYLKQMPVNAPIPEQIYQKLFIDLSVVAETPEQIRAICDKLKANKNKSNPFVKAIL